ncbi:MAG TPA: hypothetical protein ENK96_02085 [Desulfobulbaceae bacterium]|nr:hypothetical protein [Desulfobulbaceae bacterium]
MKAEPALSYASHFYKLDYLSENPLRHGLPMPEQEVFIVRSLRLSVVACQSGVFTTFRLPGPAILVYLKMAQSAEQYAAPRMLRGAVRTFFLLHRSAM